METPESDGAAAGAGRTHVILADHTVESDAIARALEDAEFQVVRLPVDQLEEGIRQNNPIGVIVDVDQASVEHAVKALKATGLFDVSPPSPLVGVIALGDRGRAVELEFPVDRERRVLPRPVNTQQLCRILQRVASVNPLSSNAGVRSSVGSAPMSPDSDLALLIDSRADPSAPGVDDLLPPSIAPGQTPDLSPEIEALLENSRQKVKPGDTEEPPPQESSPEVPLPPEIMSTVREMLNDDPVTGLGSLRGNLKTDVGLSHRGPKGDTGLSGITSVGARSPSSAPPPTEARSMPPYTATGIVAHEGPHSSITPTQALSLRHLPSPGAPPEFAEAEMPTPTQPPVADGASSAPDSPYALLAHAIATRTTGALTLTTDDRSRTVALRDGDLIAATTPLASESVLDFLVERGDLSPAVAQSRGARLPNAGRHGVAALIARGYLSQDDLWPVLRAHTEWILKRALEERIAVASLSHSLPASLRSEPDVFGGATGAEVFVDLVKRSLVATEAIERLGGGQAVISIGPHHAIHSEAAFSAKMVDVLRTLDQPKTVDAIITLSGTTAATDLFAAQCLHVIVADPPAPLLPPARPPPRPEPPIAEAHDAIDTLDAEAVRAAVTARLALVHEADYFRLLGITPNATGYDIRRAFLSLRRRFEPNRLLTANTADLYDDVTLIVDIVEEAYEILRDPVRRRRYQRAIES